MDVWIMKMWYICTMEFYSAIKNNEIMSFVGKWMKLENILLNDRSNSHKDKYLLFSLIHGILAEKVIKVKGKL
jgi:hypothetical protein